MGVVHPTKLKTKLACILEADESTRLRMGNSVPNHHEDHIAGKGNNSLQHYNLVHKFVPMLQAMKILAAKAAVDREWEKLEKISAWNLTKDRSKKEVIDKARTSGATVHFASLMDIQCVALIGAVFFQKMAVTVALNGAVSLPVRRLVASNSACTHFL